MRVPGADLLEGFEIFVAVVFAMGGWRWGGDGCVVVCELEEDAVVVAVVHDDGGAEEVVAEDVAVEHVGVGVAVSVEAVIEGEGYKLVVVDVHGEGLHGKGGLHDHVELDGLVEDYERAPGIARFQAIPAQRYHDIHWKS